MTEIRGRREAYKKGIDAAQGRMRRENVTIQLRKNKKEEGMLKRRAMNSTTEKAMVPSASTDMTTTSTTTTQQKRTYTSADIPELMLIFANEATNDARLLEAVRGLRKMLSVEDNPPVQQVLDSGALPVLVNLLTKLDNEDILFETAWALTNVASTDKTREVATHNAVPHLVNLLLFKNADVREQCAWCLGNIAGDSPELRNHVLDCGALSPLLKNIAQPESQSLLGNCVWALSNFCRGKPQPKLELVFEAIPYLAQILKSDGNDAMMDACWALSYLSDGDDERIDAVMNSGVVASLVGLLASQNPSVVTPALRCLGNFVSGNDKQTQAVLDAGVLNHAAQMMQHVKKNVRKETCWLLSNIAAGTKEQIGELMSWNEIMTLVIDLVRDSPWDIRKEATWVVSNIATGGTDFHVQSLVEMGALSALCSVLECTDAKITMVGLEAIESIFRVGERSGKGETYIRIAMEANGLDTIESLQEHENEEIYEKSISIIETFFGVDDAAEDENVVPTTDGDTFTFGVPNDNNKMQGEELPTAQSSSQQPLQTYNFNF